jgi:hypothetical protein
MISREMYDRLSSDKQRTEAELLHRIRTLENELITVQQSADAESDANQSSDEQGACAQLYFL